MRNMSFEDIQMDEEYNKGLDRGIEIAGKEYKNLKQAAEDFLNMYTSTFGEPENCAEYFKLKKMINKK